MPRVVSVVLAMKPGSPVHRLAALVGSVLLVAGCAATSGPSPSGPGAATGEPAPSELPTPTPVSGDPTPTPVPAPSGPPPGAPLCTDGDLDLVHGLVEGAAGSRFTTVDLAVRGAGDCALAAVPVYELRDANGVPLMLSSGSGDAMFVVTPGAFAQGRVQLANWCVDAAPEPFALFLVNGAEAIPVGGGPFPNPGELPGCAGPGAVNFAGSSWEMP